LTVFTELHSISSYHTVVVVFC